MGSVRGLEPPRLLPCLLLHPRERLRLPGYNVRLPSRLQTPGPALPGGTGSQEGRWLSLSLAPLFPGGVASLPGRKRGALSSHMPYPDRAFGDLSFLALLFFSFNFSFLFLSFFLFLVEFLFMIRTTYS